MRLFSEEMNNHPAVSEILVLKFQVKLVLNHFLEFSHYRGLDWTIKTFDFFSCSPMQLRGFLCTLCSKKYKPVLTENCDFERRDKSNWNAFTGCFALPNYQGRDQKNAFLELSYSTSLKFTLETSFKKFKSFVLEEYVFVYRNRAIVIAPFQFSPL